MHVKWNVEEITSSRNNIKRPIPEYLSHYYWFMHIKCDILGPMKFSLRMCKYPFIMVHFCFFFDLLNMTD